MNLSFEYYTDDKLVIHGSKQALEEFADQILGLASRTTPGDSDHEHLFTKSWGGYLDGEKQDELSQQIHHVKIYCWRTDEV